MPNQLDQLRQFTTVVADTGDIDAIGKFNPQDATTNPSLIYKAAQLEQYHSHIAESIKEARRRKPEHGSGMNLEKIATELFSIRIGQEISKLIPGRISTEIDARFSFDTQASIDSAKRLIHLYNELGVDKSRILIKIAATWEGIEAARELEKEGINCNLTLIFNFEQALASAQADAYLISPFVGRILDWYKQQNPDQDFSGESDPGVKSVTEIYNHFKANGYKTVVMGASFRNIDQILLLAGCDRLTISPQLMSELSSSEDIVDQKLNKRSAASENEDVKLNKDKFQEALNKNPMAREKLQEGIENFISDQEKLESLIKMQC